MASEVVCGLTFRLLLPVCLTAGTSLLPSLPTSLPPRVPGRVRVPGPWHRRRCPAGPAACGMLRSPSSWHLPRSAVSPRNFALRNSPLISYMFVVVIHFCRRWCPPGGAGLARVAGLCSEQLPLLPGSRVVPHPRARRGREEDSGLVLQAGWFSRRVRISGILCTGKSERLSEGAALSFTEVFRREIFLSLRERNFSLLNRII